MTRQYIYDIETYPNVFWVFTKEIGRDKPVVVYDHTNVGDFISDVSQPDVWLIGFNSFQFDDLLLKAIMEGGEDVVPAEINELAETLINRKGTATKLDANTLRKGVHARREEWGWRSAPWTCVDLMQISRKKGSLKKHQVRLGLKRVQDLPFEPGTVLDEDQKRVLQEYGENDILATEALYDDLLPLIQVREKVNARYTYLKGSALRRSDPSVADEVMKTEYASRTGQPRHTLQQPTSIQYYFDMRADLDVSIGFSTEHNQVMLRKLQELGRINVGEWKEKSKGFVFKVGEYNIELGSGGLHTIIPHQVVKSAQGTLVDYDVASYYPNLLLRYQRHPHHLTSDWLEILRELTDSRMRAKKAGDKATANVFKIIINSLYGKLTSKVKARDVGAWMRDDSLQLRVTLNGQLLLIMLAERLAQAGFKVISANTDGVLVDVVAPERREAADRLVQRFSEDTGFELEPNGDNDIFVATSVNHYGLHNSAEGKWKKKGDFSVVMRTKPIVVHNALLKYFEDGTDPKDFIQCQDDIRDFCYSTTVGDFSVRSTVLSVTWGREKVQKTLRWYRGLEGSEIVKTTKSSKGRITKSKVPNSENAVLAMHLEGFELPDDMDLAHYVSEAKTLIYDIEFRRAPKEARQTKLISKLTQLRGRGFVVVPKGRPGNHKANIRDTYDEQVIEHWRFTPDSELDFGNHIGLGAYTGREFGIVAIDIDEPQKAEATALFDNVPKECMTVWHGDFDPEAVRSGKRRGTLVFQYDGDGLHKTDGGFLRETGFEILYGKNVVQLAGIHADGTEYRYKGSLKRLPKKLQRFFEGEQQSYDEDNRFESTTPELNLSDDEVENRLIAFQTMASGDPQFREAGGELELITTKTGERVLQGLCIGHEHHSTNGTQTMWVKVSKRGNYYTTCFHGSCEDVRREWVSRISGRAKRALASEGGQQPFPREEDENEDALENRQLPDDIVDEKPEYFPKVVRDEQADIAKAIRQRDRHKLIVAPTGSGKTYTVAKETARILKTTKDKVAIVVPSKDLIKKVAGRLAIELGTDDITRYGVYMVESEAALSVGKAVAVPTVPEDARCMITHFTYMGRRGFSNYYYSQLKWIDGKTHVFLDEVDAFVNAMKYIVPFGGRRRRLNSHPVEYRHLEKCPANFRNGSTCGCEQCVYRKDAMEVRFNPSYSTYEYVQRHQFKETTQDPDTALLTFDPQELVDEGMPIIQDGTRLTGKISMNENPGEPEFIDGQDMVVPKNDFESVVRDLLTAGHLPVLHTQQLIEKTSGRVLTDVDVRQIAKDERQATVEFPLYTCGIPRLATIDRRPLVRMGRAKALTMLTATVSPDLIDYLITTLKGDLKQFDIPVREERKMDRIFFIGTFNKVKNAKFFEKAEADTSDDAFDWQKMIRVTDTKAHAEKLFENLARKGVQVVQGINKDHYNRQSREEMIAPEMLVFGSGTTLGRGLDLGHYDSILVTHEVWKPRACQVTHDLDAMRAREVEEQTCQVIQNIGRVLRANEEKGEQVKFVFVERLMTAEQFESIARELAKMSRKPLEKLLIPKGTHIDDVCKIIEFVQKSAGLPDLEHPALKWAKEAVEVVEEGKSYRQMEQALHPKRFRNKLTEQDQPRFDAAMYGVRWIADIDKRMERLRKVLITRKGNVRPSDINRFKTRIGFDDLEHCERRAWEKVFEQLLNWEKPQGS